MEKVEFIVKDYKQILEKEKEKIIKIFEEYYEGVYGLDLYASLELVTNTHFKNKILKNFISENYKRSENILNKIQKDNNYLINIVINDIIIGAIKVSKVENELYILIAINKKQDNRKIIISDTINYIIFNFKGRKIKRIYLEIPLDDIVFLTTAYQKGFLESDEDIIISPSNNSYLLYYEMGSI